MSDRESAITSIVVSGASGGVGSALARHFLSNRAQVIGIDQSTSVLSASNYYHVTANLSLSKDIEEASEAIHNRMSRIDLLVNAAGVFIADDLHNIDHTFSRLWQNNIASCVYLTFSLYDLLARGNKPLVVNIASTDGIVASGGQDCEIGVAHDVLYATTKGAMVAFTRSLAMKWAKDRIRVNAICPTIIRSPMTAELLALPDKEVQLTKHIPLGRICDPQDVVNAVDALYRLDLTTAHVLPLDGGYLCL